MYCAVNLWDIRYDMIWQSDFIDQNVNSCQKTCVELQWFCNYQFHQYNINLLVQFLIYGTNSLSTTVPRCTWLRENAFYKTARTWNSRKEKIQTICCVHGGPYLRLRTSRNFIVIFRLTAKQITFCVMHRKSFFKDKNRVMNFVFERLHH